MRRIPLTEWGKDHFSLLAYVEVRCVDHKGVLDHDHMRTNVQHHPGLVGPRVALATNITIETFKYHTRLRNGVEEGHDDWDCFYDLEEAKLIEDKGTGINPIAVMTPAGNKLAAEIRRHKSSGGIFSTFEPGP